MNKLLAMLAAVFLVACQQAPDAGPEDAPAAVADDEFAEVEPVAEGSALAAVLDAQPEEIKARYEHRHPLETLEFFGIEPGMTLLEGLPGGGWYTRLLLPYLGEDGRLIGASYSLELFPLFSFATEEFLAEQATWLTDWPAEAEAWRGDNGASISAFHFGSMPEEMAGTADAVLFVRMLHNLALFESEGFLSEALADVYDVLKPGGVFGVVQHHAPDDLPDEWADGSNGYLKKQFVIDKAEAAGFEFVAESDINANDADQPTVEDFVWRLPPSLDTSDEDPELRAQYEAIGESNRMTLKFRKPE